MAKRALSHFAEEEDLPNGQIQARILSYPKYFRNDQNQLEEVDPNFVVSQDVGWDWEVKKGVWKLRVKNDGTFEVNHLGDIYSQKLEGLGFFNADTKQRVVRSAPTLSNPTVSGDTITWDLPLGSTYKVIYSNNYLKDVLTISQAAKDWLNARRPAGWLTTDTWMALIYDMDLTQSTMIESKDFETENHIHFRQNGRVKHKIKDADVKHALWVKPKQINEAGDLEDPQHSALKWRKKKFYRNGKYVEAIRVDALDSESGALVFNTDVTFQEGVSSYAGTSDAYTYNSSGDSNFDTTVLECHNQFGSGTRRCFIKFDVSSIPSTATVSSGVMRLYSNNNPGSGTISAWRVFKAWTETGVTHNDWVNPNSEWATVGCGNASDSGSDNSGDGTDFDRKSTAEAAVAMGSSTGDHDWTITTAVQEWVDGGWANNGLLVFTSSGTTSDGHDFASSENATTANRPELLVTYTAASSSSSSRSSSSSSSSSRSSSSSSSSRSSSSSSSSSRSSSSSSSSSSRSSSSSSSSRSSSSSSSSRSSSSSSSSSSSRSSSSSSSSSSSNNPAGETTVCFQQGVSPDASYAGCTDVLLDQDAVSTNQDGAGLSMPHAFSNHQKRNLIKFDLSSIAGPVTVSNATLSLRIKSGMSNDNCSAHARRVLRVWSETQATWNEYTTGNSWTTAGALDTTNDIGSSDDGSNSVTGQTTPFTFTISNLASLIQGWINGTITNNGMIVYSDAEGDAVGIVGDSEDATGTNRPKLCVTYAAASSSSSSSSSRSSSSSSSSSRSSSSSSSSRSSSSSSSSRSSSSSSSSSSRSSSSSSSSSSRSSSSSSSSRSSSSSSSSSSSAVAASSSSSSSRSSSSSSSSSSRSSSSSSSSCRSSSSSSSSSFSQQSSSSSSSSSSYAYMWTDREEVTVEDWQDRPKHG